MDIVVGYRAPQSLPQSLGSALAAAFLDHQA